MTKLMQQILGEAMTMIDAAADQMGRDFLVDRLPPAVRVLEVNRI